MSAQAFELVRAREALDRGGLKRAFRHAWAAGTAAARDSDVEVLEAVVEVAATIRDRAGGRLQKDAQELVGFASASLANARAGIRPVSPLGALFPRRLPPATKTCPDCAETVKQAARVCRFCGHRFQEP